MSGRRKEKQESTPNLALKKLRVYAIAQRRIPKNSSRNTHTVNADFFPLLLFSLSSLFFNIFRREELLLLSVKTKKEDLRDWEK